MQSPAQAVAPEGRAPRGPRLCPRVLFHRKGRQQRRSLSTFLGRGETSASLSPQPYLPFPSQRLLPQPPPWPSPAPPLPLFPLRVRRAGEGLPIVPSLGPKLKLMTS